MLDPLSLSYRVDVLRHRDDADGEPGNAGSSTVQLTLICCISSKPFHSPQRSTIWPFSTRMMSMPVMRTDLWVTGTPSWSPSWVPVAVHLTTARSPDTITSSFVRLSSGKTV